MIKRMHIKNIQSWKDEEITFSDELVNVVCARSEKGKTVLFKIFYQMVFPNYYKFGSRNDLIRRGCNKGEVYLELYNGTQIQFICGHKEQSFKMKRDCDDDWITYWEQRCPREIINELGLIIDWDLQYILNIYIKDNQYPFINTSKVWNATLFNKVFKNEKLDRTINNLSIKLDDLVQNQKEFSKKYQYKVYENSNLQYYDIDEIKRVKVEVEKINKLYNIVDEIHKSLKSLEKALKEQEQLKDKVFDIVDIVEIKNLCLILNKINKCTRELEPNLKIVENTPETDKLGLQLSAVRSTYSSVSNISSKIATMESLFKNYSRDLNASKEISDILTGAENIKSSLNSVYSIANKISNYEKILFNYANTIKEIQKTENELAEVKSKIKVCPTCNRPL